MQPTEQKEPTKLGGSEQKTIVRVNNRGDYVKSQTYSEQEHACQICLEPACEPHACKNCKLLACRQCVQQVKLTCKRCPKRCSQQVWSTIELSPLPIEFHCPYNKECTAKISCEHFKDHFFNCEFISEEEKEDMKQETLKRRHRCNQNHELTFISSEELELVDTSKCCGCNGGVLCRSICPTCRQTFCCGCRLPQNINSRHCPLNHKFYIERDNAWRSCDICSNKIKDDFCYDDPECDFAVCKSCHRNLPQDPSTEPFEESETNYGQVQEVD